MRKLLPPVLLAFPFCISLADGGQGTVRTASNAKPLRVVLEVVNDPSAAKLTSYISGLSEQIQQRWLRLLGPIVPSNLPDGQEALISVTISPEGHPSDLKILQKTTRKDFDEAARKSVAGADFPPVPPAMTRGPLKLRAHFLVQRYNTHPEPQ